MTKLIITLALIAVVTAEAPYYSNRPSASAPAFNYSPGLQTAPAPAPAPAPHYHTPAPAPQYHAHAPQYHAPAPAPQYQAPAPLPQYHVPAPQPNYVQYPPTVNAIPQPQPQYQQPPYNYERPSIAPAFVYQQSQPAPQLPQPVQVRQQAPHSQPAPALHQSQPQQPLGYSNYAQQQNFALAAQQPSAAAAPQAYHQQTYQQALPTSNAQVAFQSQPQIQYTQSQGSSAHQFQQSQQLLGQTASPAAAPSFNQQSGVLDSHVVDRLSNILAQNEDSQARNLGYYHRVSGVSLEGVSPSVELSAFVQNVPLASAHTTSIQSQSVPLLHELARGSFQEGASSSSNAQSSSLSSASAQSSGSAGSGKNLSSYGLPTVVDNRQSSQESVNYNFVPSQNQVPSAYGAPN